MADRFWDWYAESCYDELLRIRPYREMQERVAACLEPARDRRILDVGCGTGNLLRLLADRCAGAAFTAVESSPSMLRIARRKLGERADIREHDLATPLPFPDGSFDAVACVNVLYAVPDPVLLVREICRVLVPEGRLALVNLYRPRLWWIFRAHLRSMRFRGCADVLREMRAAYGFAKISFVNRVIQWRAKKKTYHAFAPPDLRSLLLRHGFRPEEISDDCYGGTDVFARAVKDSGAT